ncbi:hypothetical protein BJX63DRAFT_397742 [Aspergillus granulosus]|uniref:F-box domain-containing protein n=1 Tax=Aspergillus granulosus TaxID=176169 RepID=A0ABR4H9G6_9EURO
MAIQLPLELWMHIAQYLKDDISSLPKYSRVCRQWQPIFERLIYREVRVESEEFQAGKGIISLSWFHSLMSSPNQYRRPFLRRLHYKIIIPYRLQRYNAVKLETQLYREQNPVRKANNQAFSKAMRSLLEILNAWEGSPKIGLVLEVHGRCESLEPQTKQVQNAGDWRTILDGNLWVVRPYRARFPDGDEMLPKVTCVDELVIEYAPMTQGIWGGAALRIAKHCVALQRLHLDVQERVRPDHLDYIRQRRQAVASALINLPPTLRVFELVASSEEPWLNALPALDLLSGIKTDELSLNLRTLSLNLKELKLSEVAVELDFLFPLDDAGAPTPGAQKLSWPYLEAIMLHSVPTHLPSGEWLFDYEADSGDEDELPDPSTGFEMFEAAFMMDGWDVSRDQMRFDQFHRLFISLGHAARRMPCLKSISFRLASPPRSQFRFSSGRGGGDSSIGTPTLEFESDSGYKPDERVAAAWGFDVDEMEVEDFGPHDNYHTIWSTVKLDRFPPDNEI